MERLRHLEDLPERITGDKVEALDAEFGTRYIIKFALPISSPVKQEKLKMSERLENTKLIES